MLLPPAMPAPHLLPLSGARALQPRAGGARPSRGWASSLATSEGARERLARTADPGWRTTAARRGSEIERCARQARHSWGVSLAVRSAWKLGVVEAHTARKPGSG